MYQDNRVLSRAGARELTYEEVLHVGGADTGCRGTALYPKGPIIDVLCEPGPI